MKALILVTILTIIGLTLVVYSPDSEAYWKSVGPKWDRMLNPCDYTECKD